MSSSTLSALFYLCSYPLEPGSVIAPGNWGRILHSYSLGNQSRWWNLLREHVYEAIRLREFPERPSRLRSIFLCDSLAAIRQFRLEANREFDLIYQVELVESNPLLHRACMSVFDGEQEGNLASLEERARIYWQGAEISKPEIITTSGVRVLARHQP